MKKLSALVLASAFAFSGVFTSAATTHRVKSGDTMWKIASSYKVGVTELINENTQITNPDLIYPGQILVIPEADSEVRAFEREVIRLVNEIRNENGLSSLTENWELSRIARYKSQDMKDNGYFSHTSPVYGSSFDMIKAFGLTYRSAGENIARGQKTPGEVVNSWMNSSGHRKNILSASYTQIGVGYVKDGNYWTQMFIG